MNLVLDVRWPQPRRSALHVWRRNLLVWRRLMVPSLLFHFGEPFLYLLGLGFGLGHFIGEMAGMPYLTFLASGIIASSAMNTASMEAVYSVYTRMVPQQTYEGMLATPLDVDDVVGGEMLWCASKALLSSTALLTVATLLGAVDSFTALLALPVAVLIGLCFAGPGMVMAAVSPSYDFFAYYVTLVLTPMFILCGVFYPIDTMPEALQEFIQVLPLTHAVALVRPLVAGQPVAAPLLNLAVLLGYTVVGYYAATVLTRRRLIR